MNVSTSALGVRRRRATTQNVDDEENAALLRLGPEFQTIQLTNSGNEEHLIALNLSEARLIVRAALRERQKLGGNFDDAEDVKEDEVSNIELAGSTSNEVVHKTLNYLSTFARFKSSSAAETVEKLVAELSHLGNDSLHPFESAQLGNLEFEDAEEAKSLIPSLSQKVTDAQLQNLLSEMRKYQSLT